MQKFLTIDERGVIRRFAAPDIDTVRAWAGRNGFVLASITQIDVPGRWDKYQPIPNSTPGTSPVTPTAD